MLCCFAAILLVTNLLCLDFEYLGEPTLEWGGPILDREVLKNTPTPLFEQSLKFIAHGRIFERLQYIPVGIKPKLKIPGD